MSVRLRLLLLVLCVAVPSIAAAVWAVTLTYQRERDSVNQSLRETTRALALVVDRELGRREAVAWTLAASPSLAGQDLLAFDAQAREATARMGGWVVLFGRDGMVLNTSLPPGQTLQPNRADRAYMQPVDTLAEVSDLFRGPASGRPLMAVSVPIQKPHLPVTGVSVVLLPEHLQRVLEEQKLPPGWIAAVLDRSGTVVARQPEPGRWVGSLGTATLRTRIRAQNEGFFRSTSLDGIPTQAFFSKAPTYGWTFVIAVPTTLLFANVQRSLVELAGVALVLFVLAAVTAGMMGRQLVLPALRLQRAAQALKSDEPVRYEPAGVRELDLAGAMLNEASRQLGDAKMVLEKRVTAAVDETRRVQERVAASHRIEALGRLTGGVAHDVNNLLAVVANNAVLLKRLPPGSSQERPLAGILRAVDTGRQVTQKLLSFARQRPATPVVLDLCLWLPETLPLLKTSVRGDVRIQLNVASDVRHVEVDAAEFELALLNLAVNANHAMPSGGTLTISAHNDPTLSEPTVTLLVQDTGEGIPAEILPHVFEPFFTTKDVSRGSGLGLSQVYGFSTQSGGTVHVESALRQGTTFVIRLPASHNAPLGRDVPLSGLPDVAVVGQRVLYVEDNAELAEATQGVLNTFGYAVEWAPTANDALRRVATSTFDLVLSDMVLPDRLGGLQLAEQLRQSHPHLPVILMTGYAAEMDRAVAAGYEVLSKPITSEELAATLARVLTLHRVRTESSGKVR